MGGFDMYDNKLLIFFENNYNEYSLDELIHEMNIPKKDAEAFLNALYKLMKKEYIYKNSKNKYINKSLVRFNLMKGTVLKNDDNSYYLISNNHSIFEIDKSDIISYALDENEKVYFNLEKGKVKIKSVIRKPDLILDKSDEIVTNLNFDGTTYYINFNNKKVCVNNDGITSKEDDLVKVKLIKKNDTYEGRVIEKVNNIDSKKVFVYKDGIWVSFDNKDVKGKILSSKIYHENEKVLCEIKDFDSKENLYVLIPIKTISNSKVITEIVNLTESYGWKKKFPKEVENEEKNIPTSEKLDEDIKNEKYNNRIDRRDDNVFTIDPTSAQDLDDAISIKTLENGNYELYVDIADVPAFVPFDSKTAKEAEERGFTAYVANLAFRMFPNKLSEEVCSLNPKGDKLTKTVKLTYNKDGILKNGEIFNSIIHSKIQMNYDDCNLALEKGELKKEYKPFYRDLLNMQKLSCLIEKQMISEGKIDFENNGESIFDYDEDGNPISRKDYYHGISNKMIEIFMIQANHFTAKKAKELGLPYIYRNHLEPSYKKITEFENILASFKERKIKVPNLKNSVELKLFLDGLLKNASETEAKYISELSITLMQRAYFDSENFGHYGLGLVVYGFFTSPIRRFSDYFNLLVWDEYLKNGKNSAKMDIYRMFVDNLAKYLTEKQILVDKLENETNYLLVYDLMSKYVGQNLNAKIEFITDKKVYLRTDNNIIGVINLRKNDEFDKKTGILTLNGDCYQINDSIIITPILEKNMKTKEIFFESLSRNKTLSRKSR